MNDNRVVLIITISIFIMFLWGIANELIHVAYNYLLTSISMEVHDLTYPIFETGIVLFAIMAWACALMPLILVVYNGSRRKP